MFDNTTISAMIRYDTTWFRLVASYQYVTNFVQFLV